ncbi:MAG: hypothetical protein NTV79_08605 [Candidatus Aureabacteria bacterium]|nr:hypothetical protein [Candidatus Auribacterota bacterium]
MVDFRKIKTVPIRRIPHQVRIADFGKVTSPGGTWAEFYDSLPGILAARDFQDLVRRIVRTRREGHPLIVGIGGHVIKCGLSPYLIDLMEKKVITALAMNGSAAIHDFEIAFAGETSEDVPSSLENGIFGMAEETVRYMNQAFKEGLKKGWGAGEALGRFIERKRFPHRSWSVLARGASWKIPLAVHIAIGTDTIHHHPSASGAVLGEATFRDFRLFAGLVTRCENGGYINIGSAVVMPEVFLKAVAVARNLGKKLDGLWTANFDMIRGYRPMENVIKRPPGKKGRGYALTGHHEIMIPLLARAVLEEMGR